MEFNHTSCFSQGWRTGEVFCQYECEFWSFKSLFLFLIYVCLLFYCGVSRSLQNQLSFWFQMTGICEPKPVDPGVTRQPYVWFRDYTGTGWITSSYRHTKEILEGLEMLSFISARKQLCAGGLYKTFQDVQYFNIYINIYIYSILWYILQWERNNHS